MSVSGIARRIRARDGNLMPNSNAQSVTGSAVADVVSGALRESWGHLRHGAKLLARQIDTNVRTVNNLIEGRNAPSAATIVRLMAADDNVFRAILELAGRTEAQPVELSEEQRRTLRAVLNILEGQSDGAFGVVAAADCMDRTEQLAEAPI